MSSKKEQVRLAAEADLETFIRLVHPKRVLGSIHSEVIRWWCRAEAKTHQLLLLPRDHQKSALVAYRVAWEITRNPAVRILYISSTANLAVKQLKFIKDILTSATYRFYWPEMVHPDEGKREKWTESEISVDHPKRKEENVRDPTIFTGGLTTVITGMHCDVSVLDDVVVFENAYTEDGRDKVAQQYSFLASIEGTDARSWIVGTRYDPNDLYGMLLSQEIALFNEEGDEIGTEAIFESFERAVEDRGDGHGEFLWPRQKRSDGKEFGFDARILAIKKAQYLNPVQFRAQYYNDPNSADTAIFDRSQFQYYDRAHLARHGGKWYIKGKRIEVFAGIDFAFSLNTKADYTAIVVVGVDADQNYYVLDIDRFRSELPSDYFQHILQAHVKWDFRKLRAEVTAAQNAIVATLKHEYIRRHGLALAIDEYRPSRVEGSKEERVKAILQPRYNNKQMWHYQGGYCQTLEEELLLRKPPHDDIKDCLAAVIDMAIAPGRMMFANSPNVIPFQFSRFGGIV